MHFWFSERLFVCLPLIYMMQLDVEQQKLLLHCERRMTFIEVSLLISDDKSGESVIKDPSFLDFSKNVLHY